MNADGDAIAIWSQYDGAGYSVYVNRYKQSESSFNEWDFTRQRKS